MAYDLWRSEVLSAESCRSETGGTRATDGKGETGATISYLATGWPADSMAARIFAWDSASNSCP